MRNKFAATLAGVFAVSGCLEIPDNAFRELAGGAKEIAISNGRNCWGNQCFTYSALRNELSVTGRQSIAVPSEVDLSEGYVSEAEFDALLKAVRRAAAIERDESDRGDSNGGSSGGSSGGSGGTGGGGGNTGGR